MKRRIIIASVVFAILFTFVVIGIIDGEFDKFELINRIIYAISIPIVILRTGRNPSEYQSLLIAIFITVIACISIGFFLWNMSIHNTTNIIRDFIWAILCSNIATVMWISHYHERKARS